MNQSLLDFNSITDQAEAIVDTLKEKMMDYGYEDISYRIDTMDLEDFSIDVMGFSFFNEYGERITPGFFRFPDCFEKPYHTTERFTDLVIHLVSNEIAIRLKQNVHYLYWVEGVLYKEEEMDDALYENATMISHELLPLDVEDGLYGCRDGLWLVEDETLVKITLFDVCLPDEKE